MKLRIFLLFLFLSLFRAQADVIDSLMTHPRDSIALTSDSLVLRFLSESGIPISDNNKVRLLKSGREKFIDLFSAIRDATKSGDSETLRALLRKSREIKEKLGE